MKLIFFFLSLGTIYSQITFVSGSDIDVDGINQYNEWEDANIYEFELSNYNYKAYTKFDDNNLMIAFEGPMGSRDQGFYFPEILIDSKFDRTDNWDDNDHWFHVSATDCNSVSSYGDFSNCQNLNPNWCAEPNWTQGKQGPDFVEFKISLDLLQIEYSELFGISLGLSNTLNYFEFNNNADRLIPETWSSAILDISISKVDKVDQNLTFDIYDINGKLIGKDQPYNYKYQLKSGFYIFKKDKMIFKIFI